MKYHDFLRHNNSSNFQGEEKRQKTGPGDAEVASAAKTLRELAAEVSVWPAVLQDVALRRKRRQSV